MFFSRTKKSIELIDAFLNCVDQGLLLFKEGVKNYLYNNMEHFNNDIVQLANTERSLTSCVGRLNHPLRAVVDASSTGRCHAAAGGDG